MHDTNLMGVLQSLYGGFMIIKYVKATRKFITLVFVDETQKEHKVRIRCNGNEPYLRVVD